MVEGVFSNDALTTVAGMAGRTSRLTIGTGIANVYLRHPVMLALSAAVIDELSGGRLVLGLGPSSEAMITRAGLPWRDQRLALRETTETARRVFAGQGLPGMRAPRAATRPVPIHWAAVALETCEAAGRLADGLMLYLCSTGRYHQAVARMARGAGAANRPARDVSVSVLIPTFLHEDLATARHAAREFLIFYASLPHYAKAMTASGFGAEMERVATALAAGDRAGATRALSDRLLDEIVLAGPAARCRDQLARFRDAGVECALLGPQRVGDRDVATQARTLVRDLTPARP
jgi:alkanesulfonate monooxygenase SsuD/methylene tetrahydromethanopterin reductase-like flavin-dependent oxidoreductase (luciferase family)